jgi:acetylornithine deacetylase
VDGNPAARRARLRDRLARLGNGALQCLLSGPSADACGIAEPHSDHITVAQVGVLWIHVDIRGRPAHAASASALGVNAIDAAATVTRALRDLEAELNLTAPPYDAFAHPINLNVSAIRGGDWASTVAAECTVFYQLVCYPDERPDELRRRVEQRVDAAADARHFVRRGIPAVCFGPRVEEVHGIDERVSIASMIQSARITAEFIQDWCGLRPDTPTSKEPAAT